MATVGRQRGVRKEEERIVHRKIKPYIHDCVQVIQFNNLKL